MLGESALEERENGLSGHNAHQDIAAVHHRDEVLILGQTQYSPYVCIDTHGSGFALPANFGQGAIQGPCTRDPVEQITRGEGAHVAALQIEQGHSVVAVLAHGLDGVSHGHGDGQPGHLGHGGEEKREVHRCPWGGATVWLSGSVTHTRASSWGTYGVGGPLLILGFLAAAVAGPQSLVGERGVRVVVDARPGSRIVAVAVAFGAGASHDPEQQPGTAHLAEHLWFRRPIDGQPVHEGLRAQGCEANAYVAVTHTVFEMACPVAAMGLMQRAVESLLGDPLDGIDATNVAAETEVIRREDLERLSRGSRGYRLLEAAMRGEDLAESTANPWSVDQLTAFTEAHWRRDNAAVAWVGDVDVPALTDRWNLTEDPGSSVADGSPVVGPAAHRRATIPAPRPRVLLGWWIPADLDQGAKEAIAYVAWQGMDRWLRERNPGFRGVSCDVDAFGGQLALVCSLRVRQASDMDGLGKEAAQAVARQLKRARVREVRPAVARDLAAQASLSAAARDDWYAHASDLSVRRLKELPLSRPAGAWEAGPLLEQAATWLTEERSYSVAVVPTAHLVALGAPIRRRALTAAVVAPAEEVDLKLEERTLNSGLRLVAAELPHASTTRATALAFGGSQVSPFGVASYAEAWSRAPRGRRPDGMVHRRRTAADVVITERVGPSGEDAALFASLQRDVMERLTAEWDTRNWVADKQFEVLRRWEIARWWANRLRWNRVNPKHRLLYELGVEEFAWMRSAPQGQARKYLRNTYVPGNVVVVALSGRSTGTTLDALERVFKGFGGRGGVAEIEGPKAPRESGVFLFPTTGALSEVAVTCALPRWSPQDVDAARIGAEVVDERLWRRLRVEEGRTYSPWARAQHYRGGSALLEATAQVLPHDVVAAARELTEAFAPSAEEIAAAKVRAMYALHRRLADPEGAVDVINDRIRLGQGLGAPADWVASVAGVSGERVQQLLAACGQNRTLTVVAPEDVASALQEAGWTPETVAWEQHQAEWVKRASKVLAP